VQFTYALPVAVEHVEQMLNGEIVLALVAIATIVVLALALSASAVHRHITLQSLVSSTERERTIHTHQLFLRQIIDANPTSCSSRLEWQFVLANKALADVYGTTVEELEGKLIRISTRTPNRSLTSWKMTAM